MITSKTNKRVNIQATVIFISVLYKTIEYSLACLFCGTICLQILFTKPQRIYKTFTNLELVSAYLIGQGILANIWLLLSLRGWFLPVIVKSMVAFFALCSLIFAYKVIFKFIVRILRFIFEIKEYQFGWKVIAILSILLCAIWITSIGRSPYGDGSGFYLAIAKVISESHSLTPLPGYEEFTSIGLQGEMHFAALMTLGSPAAAELFSWPTILAGTLMLLGISKKIQVTRSGQWIIFAMVFTSSAILELSGSGKTDLFATALGLSAYFWAFSINDTEEHYAICLTGIFTGLALVAKISYVITLLPSVTIIVIQALWQKQINGSSKTKEVIHLIFWGVLGISFAVLPHLIKNYTLLGNPLAPFGTGSNTLQNQNWYGPKTMEHIILTIPFSLTFGDYWAQMGNLSPLIIALSPFILFLPKPHNFLKDKLTILASAASIGLICWFVFRPSVLAPRYFMACALLFSIPVAKSVDLFIPKERKPKILNFTIIAITSLTICTSAIYYINRVFFPTQALSYLFLRLSECEKESRYCGLITIINKVANPGERVFFNNNIRYWLRSDLIQCALNTEETESYLELETPEQRWSFIYGRGFTFVPILNNWEPVENRIRKDLENIPKWLKITQITNQYNVLLILNSKYPDHTPLIGCHPASSGWNLFNLPIDS